MIIYLDAFVPRVHSGMMFQSRHWICLLRLGWGNLYFSPML